MPYATETPRLAGPLVYPAVGNALLDDLTETLLRSLTRSDQRRRGAAYLRGLLSTPGRKSIRNITAADGPGAEQALHHFICDSTWDWRPMRAALAGWLGRVAAPAAWVVRPLAIPKVGAHSVGVSMQFSPDQGQVLNCQRAVGVWAAAEHTSAPAHWRLHLPDEWIGDESRRRRASIPADLRVETIEECLVAAFLTLPDRDRLATRPVVLDARDLPLVTVLTRLRAAGHPLLLRINGDLPLHAATSGTAFGSGPRPARHLADAARTLRRPVTDLDPATDRSRTSLAATVPVRLSAPATGGAALGLNLLAVSEIGQRSAGALWLTDLGADPGTLVRLTRLIDRVDRDLVEIGDNVGLRDFAGRSFTGWHRHMTLASAAHAVMALSGRPAPVLRWAS
jgi:hypothetical protein